MPTPRPLPDHLPTELLTLVGKIAVQSTYIDMLLGALLGGLTGVPADDMAAKVHVLDTRRKVQDAEKVVKASIEEPERSKMLSLLDRAGDMLAERNLVVHAVVAYKQPEPKDPVYVPFRGKHVGKNPPFNKETLDPIFNDLDQISRELTEMCLERRYIQLEPMPKPPH